MMDNKIHEATLKRWVAEGIREDHISMMLELAYDMGLKEGKSLVVKNAVEFISK